MARQSAKICGPSPGVAAARTALRAAFVSVDKFRKLHKILANSPIIPDSQVKLKCAVRRTINPQRKIEEKERSAANRTSEGDGSLRRTREGVPSRLASERSRKFCLAAGLGSTFCPHKRWKEYMQMQFFELRGPQALACSLWQAGCAATGTCQVQNAVRYGRHVELVK